MKKSIILISVICLVCFSFIGCQNKSDEETINIDKGAPDVTRSEDSVYQQAGENPFSTDYKKEADAKKKELEKKMSEEKVVIKDIKIGTGAEAKAGNAVTVHYKGWLDGGKVFDESKKEPFTFNLGAGNVIPGWDTGVVGMKVGGKRELTIPSSWGYGEAGAPPVIPGNATLHFEVQLLAVK